MNETLRTARTRLGAGDAGSLELPLIETGLIWFALGVVTCVSLVVTGRGLSWWLALVLVAGGPTLLWAAWFTAMHWPRASCTAEPTVAVPDQRTSREDGSLTVELAVLVPALLAVTGLTVAFGRVALAGGSVDDAARTAARAASLSRSPAAAQSAGGQAAAAALHRQGLDCDQLAVAVNTAGFATPLGSPAAVGVHVACTVRLADVALPGLPGHKTIHAQFRSPLDQHRARSLRPPIAEPPDQARPQASGNQ